MSAEEPLPCPFCGNEVKSQSFWWHGCAPGNGPRGYYVFCLECSETDALDGPRRDTFEDALAAWNRRTPPAMSADHIPDAGNMIAPVEAVAWRLRRVGVARWNLWDLNPCVDTPAYANAAEWEVQSLYTHPAPIKPSGDTGELRERVAQAFEARRSVYECKRNECDSLGENTVTAWEKYDFACEVIDHAKDAILDLIQSERAG